MEEFRIILHNVFFSHINLGKINLPFNILGLILRLIVPVIVLFFIFKFIRKGVFALINRSKIKEENKIVSKTWIRRGLNVIYYILFAVLVSSLLGAETLKYLKLIFGIINQPFIESGGTRITIITIILTIPVFYVGSWFGKTVKRMVSHDLLERIGLDESKKFSFTSIIQYGIMTIAVLIGLSMIGIDLSALTLIFGVLGVGIGFGLQKTVSNIIAGIMIIFSRPVKEGDRIIINNIEGTVTQIKLNSTLLTTLTNESIIVPNSNFVENIIHNYSYSDRKIVIINKVQVSYDTDPEKAIAILEKIAGDHPYSLDNPAPVGRFKAFGDSGLDLSLFTWISDLSYKHEVHDQINREIWRRFKEENISIPYPHVQVIMPSKTENSEGDL